MIRFCFIFLYCLNVVADAIYAINDEEEDDDDEDNYVQCSTNVQSLSEKNLTQQYVQQ